MPKQLNILISAGPTREWIDPVRFISNPSSGKMGYALATNAQKRNYSVTLVSGPVHLEQPRGVNLKEVETAEQMGKVIFENAKHADIVIMCAAVCDHRPLEQWVQKKKKDTFPNEIKLVPTIDILEELGVRKKENQMLVGFAAETENCEENAKTKLVKKNLDWIALNDVSQEGIGFNADYNKITMLSSEGKKVKFEYSSKEVLANKMLNLIIK
ncbi:MAG: phosphopantothenoylcysteine decarboxylase [Opitutales bacterium]|nr:phosphopantothenoylcysteine decarboxylase [Opitutales bacterium]